MKPGFRENFVLDHLLQEQGVTPSLSKIPMIAENYNQRAMLHDTNFDVAASVLAMVSGLINIGSALFFNKSLPFFLFALSLLFIFIGSMALRLNRENFIKSMADDTNQLKDKVQRVAEHNTSFIKNKILWLAFITFTTLTIAAICGAIVIDGSGNWLLIAASPVIAAIVSIFIYFREWLKINELLKQLNQDIQKELVNGIKLSNV